MWPRLRSSSGRAAQVVRAVRLLLAGEFVVVIDASACLLLLDPSYRKVLLRRIDDRVLHSPHTSHPMASKTRRFTGGGGWGGRQDAQRTLSQKIDRRYQKCTFAGTTNCMIPLPLKPSRVRMCTGKGGEDKAKRGGTLRCLGMGVCVETKQNTVIYLTRISHGVSSSSHGGDTSSRTRESAQYDK